MAKKTNSYLCEYALAQVGKPYWYGTYGQTASKSLYEAKKKQYPKYYTAKDFPSQYGQRVHDCVGLIKGALWSDTPTSKPKYNSKEDYGANGLYKAAKEKGKISTFQKINGQLVFKGTVSKKTHVGVYCNGYVIEAKGHAYGVKKTKFKSSDWPFWAQCHLFENDTGGGTYMVEVRTLKYIKGNTMKGEDVKSIQAIVGAKQDGSFGPDTEKAVKSWQSAHGLTADGSWGPKSWDKAVGAK